MNQKTFQSLNPRFKRVRCNKCRIPLPHCICSYMPLLILEQKFWVVTHRCELDKPTSTGPIVNNVLKNSERVVWDRTEPDSHLLASLKSSSVLPCLLYPGEGSQSPEVLMEQADREKKELHILLLDGTWKQAAKMYNQSPYLKALPRVSINPKNTSEFKLRTQSTESRLSTVEATIEILGCIREQVAQEKLQSYFDLFQHFYMETKLNKKEISFPEK